VTGRQRGSRLSYWLRDQRRAGHEPNMHTRHRAVKASDVSNKHRWLLFVME
jgi:hypothetical protein